jgi:hypothetical protein
MIKLVYSMIVLAVWLSACGDGNEMVEAQERFADKACACKDLACIKAVQDEQNAWVAQHGGVAVGDEDSYAKIEAANKRLSECIQQVVSAAGQ